MNPILITPDDMAAGEPVSQDRGEENEAAPLEPVESLGASGPKKEGAQFTFDDMKLKVGDRLQLQPPAQLTQERFLVKVVGYLNGSSLLMTVPTTVNGLRLQLREGEKVVMRSFSGQNVFGFSSTIERLCKIPYEYMHLSFPEKIQGMLVRKAPRIKTHIVVAVQKSGAGKESEKITGLIANMSASGAALDAKQPLGENGDVLTLAFRVNLHDIDTYLSIRAVIKAILTGGNANPPKPDIIRHGIEFQDLQANERIIIQSLIYQEMIENPHKAM
ncbi:MAG: flagellar brake protein [Burkholderiales bacterium]